MPKAPLGTAASASPAQRAELEAVKAAARRRPWGRRRWRQGHPRSDAEAASHLRSPTFAAAAALAQRRAGSRRAARNHLSAARCTRRAAAAALGCRSRTRHAVYQSNTTPMSASTGAILRRAAALSGAAWLRMLWCCQQRCGGALVSSGSRDRHANDVCDARESVCAAIKC